MDFSKLKDLLKVPSVFREHSSLVLPVAVVLAGALFLLLAHFMSNKLIAEIAQESISDRGRKVDRFIKNVIPAEQWKVEKDYQHKYATDANHVALRAKQLTQRPLLHDMIFPQPKTGSTLIFDQFGQKYRDGIGKLLDDVKAGNCPTAAELLAALESSPVGSKRKWRTATVNPLAARQSRMRFGLAMLGSLKEVDLAIVDILCKDKAKLARIYADPADIAGYEFWEKYKYPGADEAIQDCWHYQIGYWITEDVFKTIEAMNSGSNSVLTSPVKRLLRISYIVSAKEESGRRGPQRRTRFVRVKQAETGERLNYVVTQYDGLTESWTARRCNDYVDVVHFRVRVLISANAVFRFMEQLCSGKEHELRGPSETNESQIMKHNQITVLESSTGSIDPEDDEHNLYRYGDDAVVELDLICEYILNRAGYDDIKPDVVKQAIQEAKEAKPFRR